MAKKKVEKEVIEMYKRGYSQRQISNTVIYYDSNKNEKFISLGKVNAIIKAFKKLYQE